MVAPFQRLLLATEHTDQDRGAEALALALAAHCRLPLAGVLPLARNTELEMAAPQVAARLDAAAALARAEIEAAARAAGVDITLQVRRGPEISEEIVAAARERAADLLVIRRRGRRSLLANLLVGEMVGKVVAHAPCSVLIAPTQARMWQRGVLAGVDPQAPDRAALATAAALAAECGLPLTLVCVADGAAARAAAEPVLAQALASVRGARGEVREGRVHDALIAAAAEHGADLIVIGRHGPVRLGRAWIGGTAQKVIGLAECPVLVHLPPTTPATP